MGCDIHVYIEKRLKVDDPWQMDENHFLNEEGSLERVSATSRDYRLFGILAGVRGSVYKHEPYGLPADCTLEIRKEADQSDWHNHSWLTLSQFKECLIDADYNLSGSESTEAFYDYWTRDRESLPEDYIPIVNYCEQWIANEKAEAMLLNRSDVNPEVRLIFWFDN
jgi:hypothetical protein